MQAHQVEYRNGAPHSLGFEDIFFNPERALDEVHAVFLDQGRLAHAWQGRNYFTVVETGFGTGINCLATWELFEQTTVQEQFLHFVSVEKYPLHADDLQRCLQPFADRFPEKINRLQQVDPFLIRGVPRWWLSPRVTLTLIFDDCERALSCLPESVDAWFLDGFAPAKNPQMWSQALFQGMAERSHSRTSVNTFTAAGMVKRGLQAAGFSVEKVPGFDRKRERIRAYYSVGKQPSCTKPKRVAVVGAGLAGAGCAYTFAQYGIEVDVFEQAAAAGLGSSSNPLLLFNPKFTVADSSIKRRSVQGFNLTQKHISDLQAQGHTISCRFDGNIHLLHTAARLKRLTRIFDQHEWHADHLQWLSAQEVSARLGFTIPHPALFYPQAGAVASRDLIDAYLQNDLTRVRYNSAIGLNAHDAEIHMEALCRDYDRVILCNGSGALAYLQTRGVSLTLKYIRGQVTRARLNDRSLPYGLCYGGFISTDLVDGVATIGSTHDSTRQHAIVLPEDERENCEKLAEVIPYLSQSVEVVDNWSGVRVTTPQREPVCGNVIDNVDVCLALGAHGAVWHSALADELLLNSLSA